MKVAACFFLDVESLGTYPGLIKRVEFFEGVFCSLGVGTHLSPVGVDTLMGSVVNDVEACIDILFNSFLVIRNEVVLIRLQWGISGVFQWGKPLGNKLKCREICQLACGGNGYLFTFW
ncbi:hypothetical protein QQ045_021904 [Rhodiola kirilowii]